MKSWLARLVSKRWFCAILPFVGCVIGATGGYFTAQIITPQAPLVFLSVACFYFNRFAFGTFESHVSIALSIIISIIIYPIKSDASVTIVGFVTGAISALALMSWMDEPNIIESIRQAEIEQQNRNLKR